MTFVIINDDEKRLDIFVLGVFKSKNFNHILIFIILT